jgi:hypothetical protein
MGCPCIPAVSVTDSLGDVAASQGFSFYTNATDYEEPPDESDIDDEVGGRRPLQLQALPPALPPVLPPALPPAPTSSLPCGVICPACMSLGALLCAGDGGLPKVPELVRGSLPSAFEPPVHRHERLLRPPSKGE